MKVLHWSFQLPFRHRFTISKGTKTSQPTFIVCLEHRGRIGWGEAPAISYYHINCEQMTADLEKRRPVIEKFALTDPERFWHFLHHLFPQNPFLVCALDMAGWDLFGQMLDKPLYKIWGVDPKNMPQTDYTLGMDDGEVMVQKMQETPWPIYKIKLGNDQDLEIVRTLRNQSNAIFRVDANAAWTLDEFHSRIQALADLGVELVEQPLAVDQWEPMERLLKKSPIPLLADESCVGESDVTQCKGRFHGINIKLTKCSGITPARRMIRQARGLGLKIMLGCMNESSIGSAAMAHLAPLVDYLDMDGPLLLKEDLAKGLEFLDYRPILTERPGLGVSVDPERFVFL